ncbi:MAG: hypothetical protein LBH62_05355 [Nitrososphaerota archaeon]|jgi:hypothetical protein|nr:hypothetical protein [Nitrososphaerota archaeon]
MPNKRSPHAFALKLLRESALFDYRNSEQLNQIDAQIFVDAMLSEYPTIDVDQVLTFLPLNVLTAGLVLKDRYGQGVLQQPGKPPRNLCVSEWREQMRLLAYQKNGAL